MLQLTNAGSYNRIHQGSANGLTLIIQARIQTWGLRVFIPMSRPLIHPIGDMIQQVQRSDGIQFTTVPNFITVTIFLIDYGELFFLLACAPHLKKKTLQGACIFFHYKQKEPTDPELCTAKKRHT